VRGFGFAPADYQQGEGYRIMYLHVPAAIWSMGIYAAMAVAAFTGLVWQMKMASLAVAAWGKPMWGTWWVWDARLTSELVLLFLYAGVIALWHAFDDRKMAGRAAGILVLVGVVNLPVIHYSVEWWNTLHQGSTRMQQSIDPAMRSPLRWAIAGYLLLFMTLSLMRMRNLILLMEKRRPWVSELILKRGHR
ncbi:heme ABC transporter permease, partial [Salmonella enterica]|nr:heme ABC transporter permease [Salmonella enterica]